MTTMKRSLHSYAATLLATATLLLALTSQNLLAQAECVATPFAGGEGTSDTPYEISSIAHLNAIRDNRGDDPPGCNYLVKHFVLTEDLDFLDTDESGTDYVYSTASDAENAKGWLPIGHDTEASMSNHQGTPFTGSFNGDGHVIRNLRIDRGGEDFVGLFGRVSKRVALIVSLGLEDLEVTGKEVVGGLVGNVIFSATVTGSYATGSVTGISNVGGLVGHSGSTGDTMTDSYATGSVTGRDSVGGLVGWSWGTVTDSYATGSVTGRDNVGGLVGKLFAATVTGNYATGSVTGRDNVGGLVGRHQGTVTDSYATGSVTGRGNVGGLLGQLGHSGEMTNSYATGSVTGATSRVGGLVGLKASGSGTVTASYWNTELSGQDSSVEGVGLTTAQMFNEVNFAGFDFTGTPVSGSNPEVLSVWRAPVLGQHFPHLRGVSKNGQVLSVLRVVAILGSAPFLLEHTFLPPTISAQAPAFSSDDNAVATIDASTGMITLAGRVTIGEEVTITVRRGGGEAYASISVSQTLVVSPFGEGTGTPATPWQIGAPAHLNAIRGEYLDDHFMLTTDLDFLGYTYEDPEKGWLPIGHDTSGEFDFQGTPFTGSFDGNGHVIRNLRINRGEEDHVGLFGQVGGGGSIVSLGLEDLEVTGSLQVGGLVGENHAAVSGSYATGSVTGNREVGGLVGSMSRAGTVSGSYATGSVTGTSNVGGLVGAMFRSGTMTDSYATGSVMGGNSVGGLVGLSYETVTTSYATGSVTGTFGVGGLVGSNRGTVTDCYATGSVTGTSDVGGLVGANYAAVSASYATGSVTGGSRVGGLVGKNNGTVSGSYATGSVTGQSSVGGLVGKNNDGTVTHSYATGSVTGGSRVGGLVGENYERPGTGVPNVGGLVEFTGGTVTQSYWNTQLSGNADSDGGVGFTTAEMFVKASFVGFDFDGTTDSEENAVASVWLPFSLEDQHFPHLRGVSKNGQILSVPRVVVMPGSAPFLLEHTLLPPTISAQVPAFSGDDDAVATIDASTGMITLAGGVTSGAVTITVQRDGNEDYAPISVSQTLVVIPFGEGTGTSENPLQISTLTQLNAIRGEYLDDHFMLTTDLDFLGYTYEDPEKGWLPIGHDSDASSEGYQGTRFTGSFDGNDHVIWNLRIDRGGEDYVGLFGGVGSGGLIVSLGLENLEVTGNQRVGGLVGAVFGGGTVTDSYATGSVTGDEFVGGLVGYSEGTVMDSYTTGSVTGEQRVGGLVGYSEGTVMDSYATGSATGASNVGGLVGENDQGTVTGSYATGGVTGDGRVGGLVGWTPDSSTVKRSYWNTELSGNADSSGGVGLTTTDMFVKANFVGFDFTGTRALGDSPEVASAWLPPISGQHFPHLRGVSKNGQILSIPGAEVITGSAPFLLVHTLLPPTVSEQAPTFSGDDDTVATIDASTGMITLAVGVTGGKAMTITVRRGGDSTYSSVTGLQVLQVKVVPLMLMPATIANQTYTVSTVIPDLNLPEATSGIGPYTYTLDPVPAGLEFDTDTRTLSGTPSAIQVATQHTYTVTDSTTDTSLEATLTFTITVNVAGTPTFMGTIEDQTYTKDTAIDALALPEATGGMGPYTYTLDPVPAGLSFDAASRTLSGTPTEATIATHTYTVTDSASSALTASLTFTITVSEALTFMTMTVEAQTYTKNTAITSLALPEATGGTGNITYTLMPHLPTGLEFNATTRMVTGTPTTTTAAAIPYTYTATDSASSPLTASLTFTVTVNAAASDNPTFASSTIANQAYTANMVITPLTLPTASGGTGNLTYTLMPHLPTGLEFDQDTRMVTGTPTTASTTATTYTYTVTNSTTGTALTAVLTFTITVNAEGSPTFAGGIEDLTYTENTAIMNLMLPSATGGTGPLTYSLTPALPADLEFDQDTRTLSGIPMEATSATPYTYAVTDGAPPALTASLTFMITVNAAEIPPEITPFGIGSQGATMHVYPNPAGNVLHIEFPGAGDYGIALLTVTGQPVLGEQHAGDGLRTLDLSTLKGGVYFLKIEDSEGVSHTFRIIR